MNISLCSCIGLGLVAGCSGTAASIIPSAGSVSAGSSGAGSSGAGASDPRSGSPGTAGAAEGGGGASPGAGSGGTANLSGAGGGVAAGGSAGVSVAGGAANAGNGGSAGVAGGQSAPMVLTSSAFAVGAEIPIRHKCALVAPPGMNVSPPLSWTPGPQGTKSYAITLNHVGGGDHWAIWDIPASTTALSESVDHVAAPVFPNGAKQSRTKLDGFDGNGYLGPCPQALNVRQSYTYTVWALDVVSLGGVSATSSTTDAQAAIKKAAVPGGSATLTGTQIRIQ